MTMTPQEALDEVSLGDLTELKAMNNPPALCKEVLEALLYVRDMNVYEWREIKAEIKNPN